MGMLPFALVKLDETARPEARSAFTFNDGQQIGVYPILSLVAGEPDFVHGVVQAAEAVVRYRLAHDAPRHKRE